MKWVFSGLQSNRINFYTTKKDENQKLKENLKSKAASLIGSISSKLDKSKLKAYFLDLRIRASLSYKLKNFKLLHLSNIYHSISSRKMKEHFSKISVFGKNKLRNLRRLSSFEKLINVKSKYNLQSGLIKLKLNSIKSKLAELKEK